MELLTWVLLTLSLISLNLPAVAARSQLSGRAESPKSWSASIRQARQLVKRMTLEEMNKMLFTYTSPRTSCTLTHGIDRLGFPGYCLNDGPGGVRAVDLVNAYPAGISVAAGWNEELAHDRGLYMGQEFKAKGTQVAFAPVVGPLGRVAEGGRNWESFGADPYLQGKLAASTIEGMQQSTIATIKHFVGNEQELRRSPLGFPVSLSSNIDDVTMHEMYMWPFQDAIRAGAAAVMCSYNRLNSTYACENPKALKRLLKGELAFPGFIISDDQAQHSFLPAAQAGLDMSLGTKQFARGSLARAVQNGKYSRAQLEDMATRVLASWFQVIGGPNNGTLRLPGFGYPKNILAPHRLVEGRTPESKPTILQSAIEGHVLVKNVKGALPLKKPRILSLYGYDARVQGVMGPTAIGGGKWAFGVQTYNISNTDYTLLIALGSKKPQPQSAVLGSTITGGGSGAGSPSFISDPYSAISQQADLDDTYLNWNFDSLKTPVNQASDACLVFINDFAAEGFDRAGLADPDSDILVENVASKCSNTIVIIHNHGIRVVDAWIRNPNVTAVLFAHTPGQRSGEALVSILYGKVSPSGRLPYTVPKRAKDFGPLLSPCPGAQCDFVEHLKIDYRHFLAEDIRPRFPFGFGLTYSKFEYSTIKAAFTKQGLPTNPPNPERIAPGGIESLFDTIATVTATLTNVGNVTAAEVAQLYVQFPGVEKLRHLRGFSKEMLEPDASVNVQFSLSRRDLSRWDVKTQQWQLQSGDYIIHVGPNVENILLKGKLSR